MRGGSFLRVAPERTDTTVSRQLRRVSGAGIIYSSGAKSSHMRTRNSYNKGLLTIE